ncbi:ankyrin repeat, SAM and basic leucine zipper domain-containing protein 1 [Pholidichthys leucotaenia]
MDSLVHYVLPAGEESDASDEWDLSGCLEKKTPCLKDQDDVGPHAGDDVLVLKRAISKGDTETVKQLLDNGMDVELRLQFKWTPLMCAVSVANYDVAELLLNRGASANFSKDHWTVLMASCTASTSEDNIVRCVGLLLSRNADPNMVDRSRMTCLMLAARHGYSKVINLLVSHGARINAQDSSGYTALAIAVEYGREMAVLKLLQLGADKSIRTKADKSPADLAEIFKHEQISRILTASSHISSVQALSSMEETLSKFFKNNKETPSSSESVAKLDDLELFLHGLDLGYLYNVMIEKDITWDYLLSMEEEDLEKIGITDPEDQQKLLTALHQMHQDEVDLDTICELGMAYGGNEELQNFLISLSQQCSYLTETIEDVVTRFPRNFSQLVSRDLKDAKATCNQLIIQTKDLQKQVICLRNLLSQMDEANDCFQIPQPAPKSWRRKWHLTAIALSGLGATVLLLYKTSNGKLAPQLRGAVF